jgi:hypothetical protein
MECTWHPSIPLLASWDPFFFRLDRVRSPGERRWLAVELRLTPVGCSGEGDSSVESSPPTHARMQPEQQAKPPALPLQAAVKGVGGQPPRTQPPKVQPNKPPTAAPAAPPQTAAAGTCLIRYSRHNLIRPMFSSFFTNPSYSCCRTPECTAGAEILVCGRRHKWEYQSGAAAAHCCRAAPAGGGASGCESCVKVFGAEENRCGWEHWRERGAAADERGPGASQAEGFAVWSNDTGCRGIFPRIRSPGNHHTIWVRLTIGGLVSL